MIPTVGETVHEVNISTFEITYAGRTLFGRCVS
jgi:hypothetical protein